MILIFLKNLQNQKNRIRKETIRKEKKALTLKNVIILLNGRQKPLHDFESGMFPAGKQEKGHISYRVASVGKVSDNKQVKTVTRKQMFQRLPIALAQVKAGNTSENLLNEIRQIIYSLYQAKEIAKKVYNNIVNSIKL